MYSFRVSMTTVIRMMLRPSPCNWLVRFLSIGSQVPSRINPGQVDVSDDQFERCKWYSIDRKEFRKLCSSPGQLDGFALSCNVTVFTGPGKCDIEATGKKVEAAATFPDNLGIIRNVQQTLYYNI